MLYPVPIVGALVVRFAIPSDRLAKSWMIVSCMSLRNSVLFDPLRGSYKRQDVVATAGASLHWFSSSVELFGTCLGTPR